MLQPVLLRLAVLVCSVVTALAAGLLAAPAASADDEDPPPPGLRRLPDVSAAFTVAVPLGDAYGRKLR